MSTTMKGFTFRGTEHKRVQGDYRGSEKGKQNFPWASDPFGRVAKCALYYFVTQQLSLTDSQLYEKAGYAKLGVTADSIKIYFRLRFPGFFIYWRDYWRELGLEKTEDIMARDLLNRLRHFYRKANSGKDLPSWGDSSEHPLRSRPLKRLYPLVVVELNELGCMSKARALKLVEAADELDT